MEISRYNLLIQFKIHSFDAQQSLSLNDMYVSYNESRYANIVWYARTMYIK